METRIQERRTPAGGAKVEKLSRDKSRRRDSVRHGTGQLDGVVFEASLRPRTIDAALALDA
jgi:hypothetical protein